MPVSAPPESKLLILDELLQKTEQNIKNIQIVGEVFVYPVLHQWLYATRHVMRLLRGDTEGRELDSAIAHLRRAYSDSCDILLTLKIERAHKLFERYKSVSSNREVLDMLHDYIKAMYEGASLQNESRLDYSSDAGLVDRIDQMESKIRKLDDCERRIEDSLPVLEYYRCRYRRHFVLNLIVVIVTVATSLLIFWWR